MAMQARDGLRIHQAIARRLGTSILAGEIPPGARIGGEIEESEALGVSRAAYREALRILIAKGLLASRPKTGTHVTAQERWNLFDPDVLEWMFAGKPDPAFVKDLFELRGIIEPAAAGLAARNGSGIQFEAMTSALDAMRRNGLGTAEGQAADQTFHRTMLAATGNRSLLSLASSIGAAVRWTTHYKQRQNPNPRDAIMEHEAVLAALVRRDEEAAAAAMRILLDLALADMADVLAATD